MKASISSTLTMATSLASVVAAQSETDTITNPFDSLTPIHLRGGVLLAPPFASIDETYNGTSADDMRYGGFQGDLLRRLAIFAKDDGFNLTFDLSLSPQNYAAALDVIANDCNTTANPLPAEQCGTYDFVVGDYYVNAERAMRIDFSPAWLRSSMSTIKLIEPAPGEQDFVTLSQLEGAGGTACVPSGTYLRTVVMSKFPTLNYLDCPSPDECIAHVLNRDCGLYVDDELALKYRALSDETRSLEVTGETFNTQYVVWPMSYNLNATVRLLIKKWIYTAVSNATLDELNYKYFSRKVCNLGTAGENCELYCDPKRGRADRFGTCVCHSIKWTGGDCSIEIKENLNLYPTWLQALCYLLFSIQAGVCISCAVWMYKNRDTRQVKAAQPLFLNLVLFGCMLSTSSILVAAQQAGNSGELPPCALFPWLYTLGFSITFSTLFAKIWRVWRLFKSAVDFQRVVITARYTLSIIFAITSVDIVICAVWTAMDPMQWVRTVTLEDKYGEPMHSVGHCTSEHWKAFVGTIAVWHTCISIMACIICYLSRNIPRKFSEGRTLAAAMVSNLQIIIVSIPVLIIVTGDPVPSLFVRAVVIWLNDFVVVAIIFGRLIYSVWDETDESHTLTVGEAMAQFKTATTATQRRPSLVNARGVREFKSLADIAEKEEDVVERQKAFRRTSLVTTEDDSCQKIFRACKSFNDGDLSWEEEHVVERQKSLSRTSLVTNEDDSCQKSFRACKSFNEQDLSREEEAAIETAAEVKRVSFKLGSDEDSE